MAGPPKQQVANACSMSLNLQRTAIPRSLFSFLVAFLFWSSVFSHVSASGLHEDTILVEDDLQWKGSSLFIDQRQAPVVQPLMPPYIVHEDATKTRSAPRSKRSISVDPKTTKQEFQIPVPFDTGVSNNFTTSCQNFLTKLRGSQKFNDCHPFSLLLQTSSAFFDVTRNYVRLTQTLDATCGVNAQQCKPIMDGFANELVSSSACETDYKNDNPVVLQAYNGLVAYMPTYQAGCLRADESGSYCFANAVSNTSSPSDSYPYYLAIGQELPVSRPTCNSCLQRVMGVFASYGNNATQPISKTYATAAQQISIACGASFVDVTAAPLKAAASTTHVSLTPTLTLLLMLILYFFQ